MNNNIITDIHFKNIIDDINNIFQNVDNDIKNEIYKLKNIKCRDSKLKFNDTLFYSFIYCKPNETKLKIVSDFNFNNKNKDKNNNDILISRTTFYEKEKLIPVSYYLDIFNKLTKLYINNFKCNDDKELNIIIVDGTYNNTNKYNITDYLETSLNLGLFDLNNEIPIDLTFNSIGDKNNELKLLTKYIEENKSKFNNCILILDRAYCSYEFINKLNDFNINYIIRFKNNCNKIPSNNRIIEFESESFSTVENDKINNYLIDGKKFNNVVLKTNNKYKLVSNLNKDYTDNKIKLLYEKRWSIEIFFKIIKSNFKFSNLSITDIDQIDDPYIKHNIKILIITIFSKIFEKISIGIKKFKNIDKVTKRIYKKKREKKNKKILDIKNNKNNNNNNSNNKKKKKNKKNKKKKNKSKTIIEKVININIKNNKNIKLNNNDYKLINEKKYINKPSYTNIINGVYSILNDIIKGKLNIKTVNKLIDCYIVFNKIDITLNNKRKCKTPFFKWYIKGYTNKSDNIKIVKYLLGFSNKKLNKNLMIKCKNSTIIKINYT